MSKSESSHSIRFGELYFFTNKDLASLGFFSSQVPDGFQNWPVRGGKVAETPGAQALRKALSEPSSRWINSFSASEKKGIADVNAVGWKFENAVYEIFRTHVLSAIKNFSEIRLRPEGRGGQYGRPVREPEEAEVRVSLDGSRVADVLDTLKNGNTRDQDKWDRIKNEFRELFPTLELQLSRTINKPQIFIVNRKTRLEAPIDAVGAGIGQTITLLTHLIAFEGDVIGIDMPELHFHPHAQRMLLRKITEYADHTQIILVTHSPTFVTAAFLENLSIMRTVDESASISQLPARYFTNDEQHKLEQHLDIWGRELFFSRGVLAVEGQTELGAFPVFAASLGIDFDKLGITVSNMGSKNELRFLVKTLRGFSIPYLAVCDRNALQNIEGQIQVSSRKIRTSPVISQIFDLGLLSEDNVRLVEEFAPHDVNTKQYSEETLVRLREVARNHNVYVLSDDFDEILEKSVRRDVLEQAEQLPDSKVIRGRFLSQQMVNEGSIPSEVREIVEILANKVRLPT